MTKANKIRGYYDFPMGNGDTKKMHFSMNFVFILQDIIDEDLAEWLKGMENMDSNEQGIALSQLVYAGLSAYDLEEGNVVEYNIYKVRDWLFTAMQNDSKLALDLLGEMTKAFSGLGKTNPVKKK